MHIHILLAACFLGTILANPIPEDTCDAEIKRMEECLQKYDTHGEPDLFPLQAWKDCVGEVKCEPVKKLMEVDELKFIGSIVANPGVESICTSEMKRREKCEEMLHRGVPEWYEDSFSEKIYPWQVWKNCVGEIKCDHEKKINELLEMKYHLYLYIHTNLRTCLGKDTFVNFDKKCRKKLPCKDRAFYDCMENEMMKHEYCNAQDVEEYDAIVPQMIRVCNLNKEIGFLQLEMNMRLFIAACFLSLILANPVSEHTCNAEMDRRAECAKKYKQDIPNWWDDSFLEKNLPLQAWKDCVGKAKCELVKKLEELTEVMYHGGIFLHKNLRTCLGNGTIEKFGKICEKPGQSKLPCDDRTKVDCIISEMKKHEFCNAQDVEAFDAIVPLVIRSINLNDEIHGGRKCESTKNLYEKTEMPKANPIPKDTCRKEKERREECFKKYDQDMPNWWEDSFIEKMFHLQEWKDCVGEANCYHVKKFNERTEVMYHESVYLHLNLRTCLGNGKIKKFGEICERPVHLKIPCEDPTFYDCMTSEMKKHEFCNAQDVEAFNDLVPLLIKDCNLIREAVHGFLGSAWKILTR